jgi:hypothetical protein
MKRVSPSEGCVWCVEVPDTGEKVVEDGDKGSTTVLGGIPCILNEYEINSNN